MCSWVIQPEEASSEILLHVRIFHRSTTNAEPILAIGTLPEFAGLDPPLSCPTPQGREREDQRRGGEEENEKKHPMGGGHIDHH